MPARGAAASSEGLREGLDCAPGRAPGRAPVREDAPRRTVAPVDGEVLLVVGADGDVSRAGVRTRCRLAAGADDFSVNGLPLRASR